MVFFNIYLLAVLGLHCYSGFSLVSETKGYSLVALHGLTIAMATLIAEHGLTAWGLWSLQHMGSVAVALWAQLPRSMWDLPRPGIKPVFPDIARRTFNHWTTREAPSLPF